ncbi:MAG: AAA family ATPase [Heliobacteriaceae bacterium]|nr:AAA family ATPase [Heliobacteriaceae bacterium]
MFKVNAGSGSAVSGGKEKLSSNVDKIVWQKSSELSAPPLSELAGMDKVKAQFDKFVKLVNIDNQSPDLFRKGAGKSKRFSFVLEGPSGTGKTFIAESLAKSLDADMVSINASDILSKYVGEAESGFSAACEAIIKHAEVNPKKQIVVFFDELEGLFRSRTAEGGSEHNSRMVNTILQELDKLKKQNKATNNITVIGTTNVYNNLDTAVQTRLKNPIYIGLPDKDTIAKVLEYQLDKAQNLEIPKGTFDYTKYGEILTSEAAKSKQINMRDLENIAEKYENFLRLNKNNTHNVSKLTEIVNDYLASKIVEKAV